MNYQEIYRNFMTDRQQNPRYIDYFETHHILPKALGGNNDPKNLIRLTAREHYLAHLLLAKIYRGTKYEAATANVLLFFKPHITSKMYGYVRERWSYAARNRSQD